LGQLFLISSWIAAVGLLLLDCCCWIAALGLLYSRHSHYFIHDVILTSRALAANEPMDPAPCISAIHSATIELQQLAEAVQRNKLSSARLTHRFHALFPALAEMRLQDERSEMLLKQLLELVNEACVFVRKFQDRSYPLKAWKMNTDKTTFAELNGRLLEAVGDLQLGLHVDVEEQLLQDMRDAQGDVQEVLELVKNSMRERGELTDKVLTEIEKAKREQMEEIPRIAQRIKKAAQNNMDMKAAVLSLQAGDIHGSLPATAPIISRSAP
jgi:hypothetical protein